LAAEKGCTSDSGIRVRVPYQSLYIMFVFGDIFLLLVDRIITDITTSVFGRRFSDLH